MINKTTKYIDKEGKEHEYKYRYLKMPEFILFYNKLLEVRTEMVMATEEERQAISERGINELIVMAKEKINQ